MQAGAPAGPRENRGTAAQGTRKIRGRWKTGRVPHTLEESVSLQEPASSRTARRLQLLHPEKKKAEGMSSEGDKTQ